MIKAAWILVALFVAGSVQPAQIRVGGHVKLQPSDISIESAFKKANAFLGSIGVGTLGGSRAKGRLTKWSTPARRSWEFWGGGCNICVDSPSGRIAAFNNVERIELRYRNRAHPGAAHFTEAEAERHIKVLAKKLGVSPLAKITRIGPTDAVDNAEIGISCAAFGATFTIGKTRVAAICFDMQDGVPLDMWIK
ncbi:MAG: hypothetical protein ACHQ50_09030 [Fimbriimonadales bacterium]